MKTGNASMRPETVFSPSGVFIGDGIFLGDGGHLLQVLWLSAPWKPIPGCPGRYVSADRDLRRKPVQQIIKETEEAAKIKTMTAAIRRHCLPGKDPLEIARFTSGGGLVTYLKADGIHVHSLNTESGLARKLEALGLEWNDACLPFNPDQVHAIAKRRHEIVLHLCICTLSFLTDKEKNLSAYKIPRQAQQPSMTAVA